MKIYLLAVLAGVVLQFLGTLTVSHYVRNTATEEEMTSKPGFHVGVFVVLFSYVLKYGGMTLVAATLIKELLF
jgi:hypothetical protein